MGVIALSERLSIILDAVGADAVVRDFNKVAASSSKLGADTKVTGGALDKMAGKLGITSQALGVGLATAATAAAGAVVAFGVSSVGKFQDLAQAVLGFQRASGATAEQSSQLVAAFDDMGISADAGGKAVFQLGKRLESSGDKLAEFGVTAARDSAGNTDLAATLLNVSDAFTRTTDPAKRAALLTAAFGKSGQDLIPILEQGRAGIEAMFADAGKTGQILSQDDIDKSEEFRLALDDLNDAVGQLGIEFGSVLVPFLSDAVGLLSSGVGAAKSFGNAIGSALNLRPLGLNLKGIADKVTDVAFPLKAVVGTMIDFSKHGDKAATTSGALGSAFSRLESVTRDVVDAQQADVKAVADLEKTLLTATSAQRSYESAQRAVVSATRSQGDAQRTLDALLAQGAVDVKAVASATRDAAEASKAKARADQELVTAQDDVIRVTGELDDLLSGKPAAEAGADAQDDLTKAGLRLRGAVNSQARAAERLLEVQNDSTSTALDLSDAQIAVEESAIGVKDAEDGVAAATTAVNTAMGIGFENSAQTITKRGELKTANEKVTEALGLVAAATQAVIDKEAALVIARAGDPGFSEDVRQARQNVADATQNVANATFDASQQAFELKGKTDDLKASLAAGGTEVDTLRTKLVGLSNDPALKNFLGGPLAALGPAAGRPGVGVPAGGGGPLSGLAAGVGALANTTINVYAQSLDPAAAGPLIVAALKQYESRNGISWRAA